jgi:hypothetical protein
MTNETAGAGDQYPFQTSHDVYDSPVEFGAVLPLLALLSSRQRELKKFYTDKPGYFWDCDQIASPQPPRLGGEPKEPFQAVVAHPFRRASQVAGVHIKSGPNA